MSGMSGRNTSVAKSKLGYPRFPFESPEAGNGYTANGPVVTYHLTPEEIAARYGPPKEPRQIRHSSLYEYWKKKEASKTMQLVNENTITMNENDISCNENTNLCTNLKDLCDDAIKQLVGEPGVVEQEPQPDKPKTRLEIVREKLTKEKYLAMKAEGLSDGTIMKNIFGKYMVDTMTVLKKEWGLEGIGLKKFPQQASQEEPKAEGIPAPGCLTIFQAIELHDELEEELESLNWLLDPEGRAPLVTSIRLLLDERRCQTATRLHRIREVFRTATVAI